MIRQTIAFLVISLQIGWFVYAAEDTSTAALDALVQRQLPFHTDSFVFHLDTQAEINVKTNSALDTFTLFDGSDGKVHIECSTKSACSRGLYTYLQRKFLCLL
jgi:hypothetical protein